VTSATKTKPDIETPAGFDAIVDDIASLRRDFTALMEQMKSGASEGAENIVGDLNDRANRLYDNVAKQGKRSAKAISQQVEEQPVATLLIAFGIGFIASRLLSR